MKIAIRENVYENVVRFIASDTRADIRMYIKGEDGNEKIVSEYLYPDDAIVIQDITGKHYTRRR